uniref:Uncharacterized protein n=1 Tax=Knipowitschia caucasica TaxID=637954 RepID=A0AAV2LER3_KNICA
MCPRRVQHLGSPKKKNKVLAEIRRYREKKPQTLAPWKMLTTVSSRTGDEASSDESRCKNKGKGKIQNDGIRSKGGGTFGGVRICASDDWKGGGTGTVELLLQAGLPLTLPRVALWLVKGGGGV